MKNLKFTYLSIFFVVVIIALVYTLQQYNKPPVNVENLDADLIINVDEILQDFQNDEVKANKKYTDNVIQVRGKISELSTTDGNAVITLNNHEFDANVICSVEPQENKDVLQLKIGDEVSLKGICTGYLLDVILVKCVIENN